MTRVCVVATLLALGCVSGSKAPAPEPIVWDRDTCTGCGMVISDAHFAAEVRSPTGAVAKFDDVGCAAKWLAKQPFSADPATLVWVARHADGAWIDAKAAHYVSGQVSPMGFNFAAGDSLDGVDFAGLSRAVQPAPKGGDR